MRLIVTRPEPDCTLTVQRLADMGHVAIAAPLLTVTFAPPPTLPEPPKAILVTSQNGVRALTGWPQHAAWCDLPAFAVGTATARALGAAGFRNVLAGDGDGAALAELVARTLAPDAGPILYPAARDRAADIPGMLGQRGHDVRLVEAYAAEPVAALPADADAAIRTGVDGVLLYSRRTAATLATLLAGAGLTEAAARATLYVLSEQVADGVRFIGAPIKIAAKPDEDSLFALIPPR
jgi:uroporphyrinogen-III synthase